MHYDRNGQPMTLEDWGRALDDIESRRIAETTLSDGKYVSTVWIGLDHSFGQGPPLIFETMVFGSENDRSDVDCARYSTESEARAGHDAMVQRWSPKH